MSTTPGNNGLPRVTLHTPDGARAEIYLHGAHLTSWKTADGVERLFLSSRAEFRAGAAIRGGVPVIFPQFSGLGPLPKHGFARNHSWDLVETGEDMARLRFSGKAETEAVWPHPFTCEMKIQIGGASLEMTFTVVNKGDHPVEFHAALHGYFAIESLGEVRVTGLGGLRWRDNPTARDLEDSSPVITFGTEVDCTFFAAGDRVVELAEGSRRMRFTQSGFADAVIWNPGPDVGAKIADLEPTDYLRYVCVEAAAIRPPLALAPGGVWKGIQRIEAG